MVFSFYLWRMENLIYYDIRPFVLLIFLLYLAQG